MNPTNEDLILRGYVRRFEYELIPLAQAIGILSFSENSEAYISEDLYSKEIRRLLVWFESNLNNPKPKK